MADSADVVIDQSWRPTLEDYVDLASLVLGTTPAAIRRLPRIGLAESAIHAPFASFGGEDTYPDLVEQAAVLLAPGPEPSAARSTLGHAGR